MPGPYAYIRQYYGVDPIVGRPVRHLETGEDFIIARPGRSHGHYVRVRAHDRRGWSYCHPEALDYDPAPRIALEQLTPAIVDYFGADTVRIWSAEHRAWWRPECAGYTVHRDRAGIYALADAYAATRHCGPEKRVQYEKVGA